MPGFRSVSRWVMIAMSIALATPSMSGIRGMASAADVPVNVMSLNVWTAENTVQGRSKLVETIKASGADIVGLQELDSSRLESLARALGWHAYQQSDNDEQILSRFPILQSAAAITPPTTGSPTATAWGVQFEISPGHTAWLFNAHLSSNPYQPYRLRDGQLAMNEAAVVAEANAARGDYVTSLLDTMSHVGATGGTAPVFLTGDFNEPSHLDWTQAAATATARPFDFKVAYPASSRLASAGFADTYRTVHPDEVAKPGYTWTPGSPPPTVASNEVHDRIDFVYFTGSQVVATSAKTIGYPDGSVNTDQSVADFPSDHRAVVGGHTISGLEGTVLTFSKLGINGAPLPQSYGDNLVTSPETAVSYAATGGGVWRFWEGGNWNLGGAANLVSGGAEPAGGAQYDLHLSTTDGFQLLLKSFELLDWADADGNGHSVAWQLLDEAGTILRSDTAMVPDGGRLLVDTNLLSTVADGLTLRLVHISGSRNDLGLDNVAFAQVTPEPSAWAIGMLGTVGLMFTTPRKNLFALVQRALLQRALIRLFSKCEVK